MTKSKISLKNSAKRVRHLRAGSSLLLASSLLLLVIGCSQPKPPANRTDVEQAIAGQLKDKYGVNARVTSVDNTLFVYIPTEERIMHLDRAMDMGMDPSQPQPAFIHADSSYDHESKIFTVSYAAMTLPAGKQFVNNITYKYTDHAQAVTSELYQTIYDALANGEKEHQFLVVVLSDITRGMEIKMTFNALDMRKALMGVMPFFEFNKRMISEMNGSSQIIGDKTGAHVSFSPVAMPDFISDLVTQNLRNGSDLKRESDSQTAVLRRFHELSRYYDYTDYLFIRLKDETDRSERLVSSTELNELFADKNK